MGSYYHFEGFAEFDKQLATFQEEYPKEFKKAVIQIAYELQGLVKEATPQASGRLADSWIVGDIVCRDSEYFIEVYTNVEYAGHVNDGHRTRGGKGYVPGVHMMDISLELVRERLAPFLQEWLDNFMARHNK